NQDRSPSKLRYPETRCAYDLCAAHISVFLEARLKILPNPTEFRIADAGYVFGENHIRLIFFDEFACLTEKISIAFPHAFAFRAEFLFRNFRKRLTGCATSK